VSVLSSIWAICEKLDVGGLGGSGGASAVAYLREIVNPMAFTYLSLIVMLLELQADLIAADLDGSIESFVFVVGKEPAIRDSGWRGRWKSVIGMNVTHLSPRERVDLLQCPDRLLTPKLRYFAFSLALPVILLLLGNNGFVSSSARATTAFELVISVGITGTVIALNSAAALAVSIAGGARERGLTQKRILTIAAAVIVANLLLFWNESAVISRADVWLTVVLDPNFREPWPQSLHHAAALGRELARPFTVPFFDGRMAIWVMTAYASLGLVSRIRVTLNRPVRSGIVAATFFGTLWERVWVNDIPSFQLDLPGINWAQAFSRWSGPIIGLEAGLLVALAGGVGAAIQRMFVSRWRARTPALPEQ